MKIIYYMPLHLQRAAAQLQTPELLDFCELFKVVNVNACMIDRTGVIPTPLPVQNLYPLTDVASVSEDLIQDFGETCIARATAILQENKPVYLMYSGGLDSTSMLLAFHIAIGRNGASRYQVNVAATPESQTEFPDFWNQVVRPNYNLISAHEMLSNVDLKRGRYVQGENADQMFGSDRVLNEPWLLTTPYSRASLTVFVSTKVKRPTAQVKIINWFEELGTKCPMPLVTMADFLWWLNFTVKWQSVALRTVSFTNVLQSPVALSDLKAFETFFNTVEFQQLSMSTKLRKWGTPPSLSNYKQSARDFIGANFDAPDYVANKQKVGSLYHVIRHHHYEAPAFGIDDNDLVKGVSYDDLLKLCQN